MRAHRGAEASERRRMTIMEKAAQEQVDALEDISIAIGRLADVLSETLGSKEVGDFLKAVANRQNDPIVVIEPHHLDR